MQKRYLPYYQHSKMSMMSICYIYTCMYNKDSRFNILQLSNLDPQSVIYLISGSPLIKAVTNFTKVWVVNYMMFNLFLDLCCCMFIKLLHRYPALWNSLI